MPISTFDATPAAPAASADASRATLSSLLSALPGSSATGTGQSAQFSALLGPGANAGPSPATTAPADTNAMPAASASSGIPVGTAQPAGTGPTVLTPGLRMVLSQLQSADAAALPAAATALAAAASSLSVSGVFPASVSALSKSTATATVSATTDLAADPETEAVRLPTRDEVEQALAMLAPLLAQLTATPAVPLAATADQVSVSLQNGTASGSSAGVQLKASLSQLTGTETGVQALQQLAADLLTPVASDPAATATAPASGSDPVAAFSGENFESDPTMSTLSQAMRLLVRADTMVRSPLAKLTEAPITGTTAEPASESGTEYPVTPPSLAANFSPAATTAAVSATESDQDLPAAGTPPTVSAQVQLGSAILTVAVTGASGQGTNTGADSGSREKNAASGESGKNALLNVKLAPEKQTLSVGREYDKTSKPSSGIAIAKKADVMPSQANTTHRYSAELPVSLPGERTVSGTVTPLTKTAELVVTTANPAATPPASLARQAVETVQALVATQRDNAAQGGVVTLNFKFGQDDLSVRVQLRAGEVRTQFSTNSPELRAALATEWQSANRSAGISGLRLAEPDFVSAAGSTGSQSGGFTQGQFSSQQQAQQQAQTPATALLPELRALRRVPAETPAADSSPSITVVQPTSLHLTAVA